MADVVALACVKVVGEKEGGVGDDNPDRFCLSSLHFFEEWLACGKVVGEKESAAGDDKDAEAGRKLARWKVLLPNLSTEPLLNLPTEPPFSAQRYTSHLFTPYETRRDSLVPYGRT